MDTLLGHGIASLQRLHDRVLTIDKLRVWVDLAKLVLSKVCIQLRDSGTVFGTDLVLLVSKSFAQLVEDRTCINELNFTTALLTLVLRQHPNVCSDTCVVEQVNGKCDDRFHQVIFK